MANKSGEETINDCINGIQPEHDVMAQWVHSLITYHFPT
jgi:hypothetical protein